MIEIIKKTLLAGADYASKTWDEVEALAKEVAAKAKMSENEGSKFLKELKSRYDNTQKKLEQRVEKVVKDILKKMDIATAADIKGLKKDIQQLKKAVGSPTAKKRTRTAAKKRTATGVKKRASTATAKKRTSTRAKKGARTAAAKKRTSSRASKKR